MRKRSPPKGAKPPLPSPRRPLKRPAFYERASESMSRSAGARRSAGWPRRCCAVTQLEIQAHPGRCGAARECTRSNGVDANSEADRLARRRGLAVSDEPRKSARAVNLGSAVPVWPALGANRTATEPRSASRQRKSGSSPTVTMRAGSSEVEQSDEIGHRTLGGSEEPITFWMVSRK
jgi:hypothetical protein